jgi:predicted Zn finger-like uncharacterized protein
MASTITITCPECAIQIKAPAGVEGKKIRCKSCGHAFVARAAPPEVEAVQEEAGPAKKAAKAPVKAPAAKAPPARPAPAKPKDKPPAKGDKPAKKPPAEEDEEDDNPYKVTALDDAARCPECANEMEEEAVVCLHCGFNTQTREKARTRKIRDVTGFDMFLWLLPGIACVLAIILLIGFDILYCVKIEDWIEKDAWYDFIAHYGFKIWIVIPSLFLMYKAGYFAVKRLIINNTPPEVEEKMFK